MAGVLGGSNPRAVNGTVSYSVLNYPSKAINDEKIFTITFKAIATGSATLNFSANTSVNDGPTSKKSSTFTIQNPTCPAGQIGTPPNCRIPPPPTPVPTPTPQPTPQPTTPKPTLAPAPAPTQPSSPAPAQPSAPVDEAEKEKPMPTPEKVVELDFEEITVQPAFATASIDWQTATKAASTFTYGTSAASLDTDVEVEANKDGMQFSTRLQELLPGTTYYYQIVAKANKDQTVIETGQFTTKAYPVTIRVTQDSKPTKDVTLKLRGSDDTYTTNDKGQVDLSLPPGKYTLTITKDSLESEQVFTVKALEITDDKAPKTQVMNVAIATVTSAKESTNYLFVAIIATIGILLVGIGVWLVIRHKRHTSDENQFTYSSIVESTPYEPQSASSEMANTEITWQTPATAGIYATPASVQIQPIYSPQPQYYTTQQPESMPEEEPLDMWSAAETQNTPNTTTAPPVQQPYVQPETEVSAPITTPTPQQSIETTDTQQPWKQASVPPQSYSAPPAQSQTRIDYMFEPDNSLAIRHS
ncbi:MAG: conserved repeat domain protein [Candidatus Saccharibacteria bacterium GW2011_GWC2_48_9]|nr:MAG: conserved repeat domain protein [Candidatus Saccharibacteria bacterium GW2011_GWC2_48_9]